MSLNIPVSYDDETRMLSVSEEWAGTTIDDRSTTFIVSGIPSNVKSAKLDVKVAVRSTKGKTIRPFMILKGIESGVGSATIPSVLLNACKRDRKFIFQLELMTEDETYASKNWITLAVSDSVFNTPSGMDQWNQDNVLVDAYEVQAEGKIVFKRFSGDEFSILLSDNEVSWEKIKNVPWRKQWSTGTPTDKDILCESLVKGELDNKTDIKKAIPEWDSAFTYANNSTVIRNGKAYRSKSNNNKGFEPTSHPEKWEILNETIFRSSWTEGTPSDKEALTESFLHGEFDKKTDITSAIPEWSEEITYPLNATVIIDHGLYQSLKDENKGYNPTSHPDWWTKVSGSGGGSEGAFTTKIGDGTTKVFTIAHNLNSEFYIINIINTVTGHNIGADVKTIDANNIEISFSTAPVTDGMNVIVSTGSGGGGGGGGYSGKTIRQDVASAEWTVVHNLGRHVIVQTFDDSWNEIFGDISEPSENQVKITFSPATLTGYIVVI